MCVCIYILVRFQFDLKYLVQYLGVSGKEKYEKKLNIQHSTSIATPVCGLYVSGSLRRLWHACGNIYTPNLALNFFLVPRIDVTDWILFLIF